MAAGRIEHEWTRDIKFWAVIPDALRKESEPALYEIGGVTNYVVSTHEDKFPVLATGAERPRGFTASWRTVAGTIIFGVVQWEPFRKLKEFFNKNYPGLIEHMDQLPLIDAYVTHTTEEGVGSIDILRGFTLNDMGYQIDAQSLQAGRRYTWQALDIITLTDIDVLKRPEVELPEKSAYIYYPGEGQLKALTRKPPPEVLGSRRCWRCGTIVSISVTTCPTCGESLPAIN